MALNARTVQPARPGLLDSLRRLASTAVAILHSRVELLAKEFERERIRVMRLLLVGLLALFFFALGAITLTIFVIVLFWDSQRLVAIGFLTLVYLGIAAGLALFAKSEAGRMARPFSATVAELKKDRERFGSQR
ncbi:MAG: hypothetical protein JWO70_3950 [Betaproteobacteria bacterium]|nr:hypothetical protein [Betaproteobacteria bacterium]